jgi:hypothetical protein
MYYYSILPSSPLLDQQQWICVCYFIVPYLFLIVKPIGFETTVWGPRFGDPGGGVDNDES